jgi:hypothetical protein
MPSVNAPTSARTLARAARAVACAVAALAAAPAGAASLSLAAGTMPAAASVPAGASGAVLARFSLTATGGTVRVASLSLANQSGAAPGTAVFPLDLGSVVLFDVSTATTAYVASGVYNAGTQRYDFKGLNLDVTATSQFAVVLNFSRGATVGRTFSAQLATANIAVVAPSTVTAGANAQGNVFTAAAGTAGGSTAANTPMVYVSNPASGALVSPTSTGQLKVQLRVANVRAAGIAGVSNVQLSTDNGSTWAATARNGNYDAVDPVYAPTVTGATYEATLSTLGTGCYTLRARATGAGGTTVSEPVQITVGSTRAGAGNLLVRDNSSQLCTDCHALATHSSEAVGYKYGAWAATCRDCHQPHGTRNIYVVEESIVPPSVVGTVIPTARVGFVAATGATLSPGWDTTNLRPTATASFANSDNSGPCQVCHTRTRNPGSGVARWQRQANADTHYTQGAGTAACSGCHSHTAGFGAGESGGGATCSSCHGTIWSLMNGATASKHTLGATVGTNDAFTDSGVSWVTSPLSSVAPAQRSCVNMCHGDHPHDLTSPVDPSHSSNLYVDPTSAASRANGSATRTAANRANEDFDPATNTGLCVKCHANPISTGRPTISAAVFGASAHDYVTNVVTTVTYSWQYNLHNGATQRNCTKCHASRTEGVTPGASAVGSNTVAVHGTPDPTLLAGAKLGSGSPFVCFNCHGSTQLPAAGAQGDRSGKPIQAQLAKAHSHPVTSDASHDSVAERSGAAFGNALGGKARHVDCLDCHDTHAVKAGTHTKGTNLAGPSLEAAWGAQFLSSIAFWTSPAAGNFAVKTIVAGVDAEATLCFKCHSSFYGTLPTTPSGTFTETDTAKEFNPGNQGNFGGTWSAGKTAGSFHPVLASAASNLGATNSIIAPFTKTSLMTCSDCHASDTATDPAGPHGSAAAFILKGPNTVWNNTLTLSTTGMPAGTFCANCHNANWTNSRGNPPHNNGNHSNVPCMNCHAAIPHGGPRPGLLNPGAGTNTTNLPAIAGWDGAAPYWQGGTTQRLYLVSYPANQSTSWAQSNCGCNGTSH